ncbi:alcohol dehydrogenase catalytic domain-containing protein [Streptomyces sp. NPDC006739]|uniref:alcohol dehydrogenase catalytic domain-containing protein n=1 Tax=Streptomyces sp. NPDC006739 TaxID=3364763 RepID=UPI0036904FF5
MPPRRGDGPARRIRWSAALRTWMSPYPPACLTQANHIACLTQVSLICLPNSSKPRSAPAVDQEPGAVRADTAPAAPDPWGRGRRESPGGFTGSLPPPTGTRPGTSSAESETSHGHDEVGADPCRRPGRDGGRPVPGPKDVLVNIRACGICGTDVTFVHMGGMPARAHLGGKLVPVALGHEPAADPDRLAGATPPRSSRSPPNSSSTTGGSRSSSATVSRSPRRTGPSGWRSPPGPRRRSS